MQPDTIGITSTIPVEIVYAAGRRVRDLNNLLVADPDPVALVALAERAGFPAAMCAWVKGIYGVIRKYGVREVIGVVEGDCAETGALLEILASEGVTVHPFAYPHDRDRRRLAAAVDGLARRLGTTAAAAERGKRELDRVRCVAAEFGARARTGNVPTGDLFAALISLTDFAPDPAACERELRRRLRELDAGAGAGKCADFLRLGYLGVPPIFSDLWEVCEDLGARFVYLETPRQFAMLHGVGRDLLDTYLAYTYPYGAAARVDDVVRAVREYELCGLVHYVQGFCHRRLHDRLLREAVAVPVLTLEADRPGPVDARALTRLEAFVEGLRSTAGR